MQIDKLLALYISNPDRTVSVEAIIDGEHVKTTVPFEKLGITKRALEKVIA